MDHNKITVIGKLESELTLSHMTPSEAIYTGTLLVPRTSGIIDSVPLHVPGRLYDDARRAGLGQVIVSGVLRVYSVLEGERSYTRPTLLASYINEINDDTASNYVSLVGTICKPPVFRLTPFGREICDIMLAVNGSHEHINYIPCITWGGNARRSSKLEVGTQLHVVGRFQSREYNKLLESGETEKRMAYEVSVNHLRSKPGSDADGGFKELPDPTPEQ